MNGSTLYDFRPDAYARVNGQNQVIELEVYDAPTALHIYCLVHLTTLTIIGTHSWPIPYEIGGLTNLTSLALIPIAGDIIPATISELKQLRDMTLGGSNVTQLTGGVAGLSSLTDLYIDLPLNELPSFLCILPLRSLSFSSKAKFTSIPQNFFKNLNPTLRYLEMSTNQLVSLDEFVDLTKLDTFELYVDNMTVFPWQFTYLSGLETLNFRGHNQLSVLPHNFSRSLAHLDLSNNAFTEIPTPILLSKTLTNLDLSYNQIVDITSIALTKSPLTFLSLANNQLESVPPEISHLSNTLSNLYLYHNKLTTLPAEKMVKMKVLYSVDVSLNNINSTEIVRLKSIFANNLDINVRF